jgi:hypothetical protein
MKNNMRALAAIMALTAISNRGSRIEMPSVEKSVDNVMREKGMTLFNIEGIEVWALNEKNAKRKAKKIR